MAGKGSRFPPPGPESRFYVAPASDKMLRWTIAALLITPTAMLAVIVGTIIAKQWPLLLCALLLLCCLIALRWFQIRALARELSERRSTRRNRS